MSSNNIWCHPLIKIIRRKKSLHTMTGNDNRDTNSRMNMGYLGQIYLVKCSKT